MPPLSVEIRGDCIYGRSAIDTKGLGIPQLSSFLALRDSSEKLNRDVIFRPTADEEAGGHYSAGWLLEHRPETFKEAGYLVNEGGSKTLLDEIMAFNIEVTQQLPLWLRLTAADILGHSSAARKTSSVKKSGPMRGLQISTLNEEPYQGLRLIFCSHAILGWSEPGNDV